MSPPVGVAGAERGWGRAGLCPCPLPLGCHVLCLSPFPGPHVPQDPVPTAPCPQTQSPVSPWCHVPLSPCPSSCPQPQGRPKPDLGLGALTGLSPASLTLPTRVPRVSPLPGTSCAREHACARPRASVSPGHIPGPTWQHRARGGATCPRGHPNFGRCGLAGTPLRSPSPCPGLPPAL